MKECANRFHQHHAQPRFVRAKRPYSWQLRASHPRSPKAVVGPVRDARGTTRTAHTQDRPDSQPHHDGGCMSTVPKRRLSTMVCTDEFEGMTTCVRVSKKISPCM